MGGAKHSYDYSHGNIDIDNSKIKLHITTLTSFNSMEEHTLKNVNNCLNTNIYSYVESSGGQSSNLYFDIIHFSNTSAS